jgi:hypothetical protein
MILNRFNVKNNFLKYIYIYYFNIFLNKKHVEKQPLPQSQKTHSSIHPLILKNKENANDNTDSTHMEI